MIEKSRIIGLDYLRGGAAVAVVIFHLGFKGPTERWMDGGDFGWFSSVAGYGYLGVNLFFIISGFVIAMSAEAATWQSFLRSRIIRLVPAMWICASVTAIGILAIGAFTSGQEVQSKFVQSASSKNTWGNYFASLTLAPAWFGFVGIDAAYWSLRIEVQFYLAVCLLLLFDKRSWTTGILIVWLVGSTINLIRPIWRIDFVLCLTWAPYFVVGIIFHSWRTRGVSLLKVIGLAWSSLLCVSYGYKSAVKDGYEIPIISCSIVIGLIALFALTIVKPHQLIPNKDALFAKIGLGLGAISYPLYLIHQELGYALFNGILAIFKFPSSIAFISSFIFTLSTILTLSWIIHRWPERMLTKNLRKYLPLPEPVANP
jgi:peptidoglycan/LPS O-acetylase OafA/YrhL